MKFGIRCLLMNICWRIMFMWGEMRCITLKRCIWGHWIRMNGIILCLSWCFMIEISLPTLFPNLHHNKTTPSSIPKIPPHIPKTLHPIPQNLHPNFNTFHVIQNILHPIQKNVHLNEIFPPLFPKFFHSKPSFLPLMHYLPHPPDRMSVPPRHQPHSKITITPLPANILHPIPQKPQLNLNIAHPIPNKARLCGGSCSLSSHL